MITVNCHFCGEACKGTKISEAMDSRRFHEEQFHREARVETDTSTQT